MACSAALIAIAIACQSEPAALAPIYRQALEAREKQFGPNHPRVARSASDLGLFLRNQGDRASAEPFLRRALAIDQQTSAPDSPLIGEDLENLASVLPPVDALPLYQRCADNIDAKIAARCLTRLGSYEEARSNHDAAVAFYRRALAKEETAVRLNDVALLVSPKEAEPLLRRALAIQEKTLSPRDPEKAVTLNNLANVLLATGRGSLAEPVARRALSMLEAALGPNHPRVATSASNLADILRAQKNNAAALRYYRRALAIDEKAYGPAHPEIAVDLENLADLLEEMKRSEEALSLRKRAAGIKVVR
jgi:tetratricopeptide (TPR) repeat protein